MPPYTQEIEAIRRARILEAALETIAEKGCANVTMDDICRASGFSKGGLAHYYQSKQALFLAAFTEFFDRIFKRGKAEMDKYEEPIDKLLSFTWLYNVEDPDAFVGYPVLFDFMAIAVHDSAYRRIFYEWVGNWVVLLKAALAEGVEQGIFREMDCEKTAQGISAVYQGIATRWFLAPDDHSRQWALETLESAVLGLLNPRDRDCAASGAINTNKQKGR